MSWTPGQLYQIMDTIDPLTIEQARNMPEEELLHHPIIRVAMERVWFWAGGVGTPPPNLIMPPVSTCEEQTEAVYSETAVVPPYPPPPYPSSGRESANENHSRPRRSRQKPMPDIWIKRLRKTARNFEKCLDVSILNDIRRVMVEKGETQPSQQRSSEATVTSSHTTFTDAEMTPPPSLTTLTDTELTSPPSRPTLTDAEMMPPPPPPPSTNGAKTRDMNHGVSARTTPRIPYRRPFRTKLTARMLTGGGGRGSAEFARINKVLPSKPLPPPPPYREPMANMTIEEMIGTVENS